MTLIDERQRLEAERVANEAKEKADQEAAAKAAKEAEEKVAKEKELEGIPEALRGKTQKEIVDMMLSQSAELEREKAAKAELEKKVPRTREEELTPDQKKAAMERAFFADPITFLETHVFNRTKPLADATFETQSKVLKETTRRAINSADGEGEFEKREKRIDEILAQLPPEVRANPAVYEATYNIALGEEERNRRKEAKTKSGLHSETGGGGGGTEGGKTKPIPKNLSDLDPEQIERAAKRFGMSREEYIDWAEKYEG